MIETTDLEVQLTTADAEHEEARAALDKVTTEYRDVADRLAAIRAKPADSDYPDPESWRKAIDERRFVFAQAARRRKELEADQRNAVEHLAHARAVRDALTAKLALIRAVNAIERGEGNAAELQRARTEFYAQPGRYRPHDFNLAEAVQRARLTIIGLISPSRACA